MDEYYTSEYEWIEVDRPKSRCRSARTPRTPRTPRALSPRRKIYGAEDDVADVVQRNNERNRRSSRPASARDPPRSACSRRASLTKRPAFTIY